MCHLPWGRDFKRSTCFTPRPSIIQRANTNLRSFQRRLPTIFPCSLYNLLIAAERWRRRMAFSGQSRRTISFPTATVPTVSGRAFLPREQPLRGWSELRRRSYWQHGRSKLFRPRMTAFLSAPAGMTIAAHHYLN